MFPSNVVCADVSFTNSWQLLEGMTIGETAEVGGMIFYPIGVRLSHPSHVGNVQSTDLPKFKRTDTHIPRGKTCPYLPSPLIRRLLGIWPLI